MRVIDLINMSHVSFTKLSTETFESIVLTPSFEEVRQQMMNNIHMVKSSELKTLEDTLNDIITNSDAMKDKNLKKLLQKLPGLTDEVLNGVKLNKDLGGSLSDPNLEAQRKAAWARYHDFKNKANKDSNTEIEKLSYIKEREKARAEAMSLQSRVSSVTGKAFEGFLDILTPLILSTAEQDANAIIQQMEKQLGKKKKLTLTGGDKPSTISFSINYDKDGKDKIQVKKRTISSLGKIDVTVSHPETGEQLARISAKNYSTLRDIHLLGGGNLLGMIAAWPMGAHQQAYDYVYTGLGHWSNDFFLSQAKPLLAIQSLAGRNQNSDELADIFILNIRNNKRPIKVLSVGEMLYSALQDRESTNKAFKISIEPSLPIRENEPEQYMTEALKISVDTTLQKQWLRNYLATRFN